MTVQVQRTNIYVQRLLRGIENRTKQLQAERKAKQQEPQEIQAVKEKIQQQLLTMADLKAQIDVFKNADNGKTKNTSTIADTNKLSDEQYQTTIIQKMIDHIHTKRNQNNDQ